VDILPENAIQPPSSEFSAIFISARAISIGTARDELDAIANRSKNITRFHRADCSGSADNRDETPLHIGASR